MGRARATWAIGLTGAILVMLAPAAAYAVVGPGGANGFNNTYGQTGGIPSDPSGNVCYCHTSVLLKYSTTKHGQNVTVADGVAASIDPTPTRYWPTPTFGNSLRFNPADIGWVIGSFSGPSLPPHEEIGAPHEYVLRQSLWGSTSKVVTVSTGATFAPSRPIDDAGLISGLGFDHEETSTSNPQGSWVNDSPVSVAAYFQRCGGCHTLGLTRPANATSTIGNGAQIKPSTPTSWAALGVNCENCHGTGKMGSTHPASMPWFSLPGVVGAVGGNVPGRALSSDVCGQCHVSGTTSEKRIGSSTSGFSNPNGYTPDVTLAAWNITSAAQGAFGSFTVRRLSMDQATATVPGTAGWDARSFYPSGHNKNLRRGKYSEWLESGHARSRKTILVDMAYLPASVKAGCLKCHTAEGYLASKGYRSGPFGLAMTSSPATDRYSVECAVCHSIHDQTTGLGLRVAAEDICQQCHTGSIVAGREATPGAQIHQPQQELVAGYGLIDVPTATALMPGAECPDCHMPGTSGGRKSHRFTVMLPGDADAWQVEKNGDSCTPCHASRSRQNLQEEIDHWQDTVAAEATKALVAINAAKARPASATPTGISLINRAYTDWSFTNDPGAATHNFPYMLAGMKKATAMARSVGGTLRLEAAATTVNKGRRVGLGGDARFGDGVAAAGETIVVEKKTASDATWTVLSTTQCDADGEFAVAPIQNVNTAYRAYWKASGVDRIWAPTVAGIGVRTKTSIAAAARIRFGARLAIRGSVSPLQSGSRVAIYVKVPGSRGYRLLTRRRLTSRGYSLWYRPSARGVHRLYAMFPGNAQVLGSASRVVSVVVR